MDCSLVYRQYTSFWHLEAMFDSWKGNKSNIIDMQIIDSVKFSADDPHGNFKKGDTGALLGFVSGGDNTPCGVVLHDGLYEPIPLYFLRPFRGKSTNLKNSIYLHEQWV